MGQEDVPLLEVNGRGQRARLPHQQDTETKTIDFVGSVVLCLNNITGPGMLAIPLVFQQAGWLVTSGLLLSFMVVSSFAATFLCEAMALIPGNAAFQKRVEFSTVVLYFFGEGWHVACQVLLCLCLQSVNVAGIVVSAQAMDQFILFFLGHNHALQLSPSPQLTHITTNTTTPFEQDTLFGDNVLVVSLGYVVVMALCLPLGAGTLGQNMWSQYVSAVVGALVLVQFVWLFVHSGLDPGQVKAVGDNRTQVISVVVLSYSFVTTVPSWVNEKRENVSVQRVVWLSALLSTGIYIALGVLGAMALPHVHSDNFLTSLSHSSSFSEVSVLIFTVTTIIPGSAVSSILVKYNLYVGGVCSKRWALFWGVVVPWAVGFVFYSGTELAELVNWTSLLFAGLINFVVPMVVFLRAKRVHALRQPVIRNHMLDVPDEASDGVLVDTVAWARDERKVNAIRLHHALPRWLVRWGLEPQSVAAWVVVVVGALLVAQVWTSVRLAIGGDEEELLAP